MNPARSVSPSDPALAAGTALAHDDELHTLAAHSPDAVLVIGPDGVVRLANTVAAQLFGRTAADLIGQPLGFAVTPGVTSEIEVLRPDNAVAFVELRAERALWGGGPAQLLILHDVTGRKRAEQLLIESQLLLRSALDALDAKIAILDADGSIAAVNEAWRAFAREAPESPVCGGVGARYLERGEGSGTPQAWLPLIAGVRAVLRGATRSFHCEHAFEQAGSRRWLALHVASAGEGRWGRAVVTFEEITERKHAERLVAERHHVLELLARQQGLEQVAAALLTLAAERYPDLRYAAVAIPAARVFCSRSRWLLAGERDLLDAWSQGLASPRPGEPALQLYRAADGAPIGDAYAVCWAAHLTLYPAGAEARLTLCRAGGAAPTSQDVRFVELVGQLLTIAMEQHEHNRRLAHQAHHDPLTGLPNRALFDDRLQHALEVARRAEQLVGVLFIDLDRFKQINDTLGHAAGDALLVQLARRFEGCVRASDTLARRGGDEFMLVLPEVVSPLQVSRVAERLHERLALPFNVAGHELFVSASIGAAIFPADGEDADTLQRNADTAMYRAKSTLHNSFQFFNAGAHGATLERLRLETSLRRAVERRELSVHYQPKVDRHGRLVGAEALLRWNHPELGSIPPSRFIPLAEELGLIVPIGEWCLTEICEQLAAWQRRGHPPLRVAVNISAVQFAQPGFLAMITAILSRSGVDPALIELELTESMLMGDIEAVGRLLHDLRALRLSLAIDDFGTGYSSLGYLNRLPISVLKVDRSFIGRIGDHDDDGDRGIVSAIITLGHHLHMQLVAEGVETEAQRHFLAGLGCDLFQGYLFSRPLPAARFERLLRR